MELDVLIGALKSSFEESIYQYEHFAFYLYLSSNLLVYIKNNKIIIKVRPYKGYCRARHSKYKIHDIKTFNILHNRYYRRMEIKKLRV